MTDKLDPARVEAVAKARKVLLTKYGDTPVDANFWECELFLAMRDADDAWKLAQSAEESELEINVPGMAAAADQSPSQAPGAVEEPSEALAREKADELLWTPYLPNSQEEHEHRIKAIAAALRASPQPAQENEDAELGRLIRENPRLQLGEDALKQGKWQARIGSGNWTFAEATPLAAVRAALAKKE